MTYHVTSDLHLGHKKIIKMRGYDTAQQMHESMVSQWNAVVQPKDIVYVLGDTTFTGVAETVRVLTAMRGRKILITGNHDDGMRLAVRLCFEGIHQSYFEHKEHHDLIVMCHYPIESWNNMHHGSIHLHGHSHGNLKRKLANRFDMGWDVWREPVSLDRVRALRTAPAVTDHHHEGYSDGQPTERGGSTPPDGSCSDATDSGGADRQADQDQGGEACRYQR